MLSDTQMLVHISLLLVLWW